MKTILKVSEKQRLIVSEGYVYLICEKLGDNDFVSNCFKAKKDDVLKQFGSISELIEYLQSINDDDSVEDIFDFEDGYCINM